MWCLCVFVSMLCVCLSHTVIATLWAVAHDSSVTSVHALGEIKQGHYTQYVATVPGGWVGGWRSRSAVLDRNTLPVTTLTVESWELITSKAKCVKVGESKREEVLHLFINSSSSLEDGLDVLVPTGSHPSKGVINSSSVCMGGRVRG